MLAIEHDGNIRVAIRAVGVPGPATKQNRLAHGILARKARQERSCRLLGIKLRTRRRDGIE